MEDPTAALAQYWGGQGSDGSNGSGVSKGGKVRTDAGGMNDKESKYGRLCRTKTVVRQTPVDLGVGLGVGLGVDFSNFSTVFGTRPCVFRALE